ncbi:MULTISPECIES: AAA family ATPase [Gammaproteobacteria]|uniref:AAA family ATPase n=1 Tax=Gammaproteobacteria TaxID=1236 RepID=UPI0016802637|nr:MULTISPECIES: AAA family ATPase [Gammaproteobacteria]MCK8136800.1 AAA family ATPase [Pseudoalteromonas sp. 2CM28B]MCQ8885710.1 AAA family ATPase [Pseudoalteromonas agarivorans]
MKLKKLIINGLFGHFNHVIKFKDENITIVTAPNGYGKTICLKVIDSIFNRKLSFLCDLQFRSIELYTSNGTLEITKSNDDERSRSITLGHSNESESHEYSREFELSKSKKLSIHGIDLHVPFLQRVGPREWEDHRTEEIYTFEEVIENFAEYLPDEFTSKNYPQWFIDFSDSLNAHFVQDQRLIQRKASSSRGRKQSFIDTIEKYAAELAELIRDSGFQSSHVSQQLDTTFPVRLLTNDRSFKPKNASILKEELQALQNKRSELSSFNLLSSEQHLPAMRILDEIKDEDRKVLTLYVEDTNAKLKPYENIYKKIELFSRILNSKRLSFKKIKIEAEKGFHFETDEKRPLKLTQLSSGEQHQVVLLYELIFKTKENVLVLIDEPEISLHVAWQKEFLKDLEEIIEIQNMPVVIATHSPQIIDGKWELTVDLEGGLS